MRRLMLLFAMVGMALMLASTVAMAKNISGTDANEVLTGTKRADTIDGMAGNDQISGRAGNDKLIGATGDDSLTGGKGDDVYDGGDGNDHLFASEDGGRDKLYCGEGTDYYYADERDYVDSSCEWDLSDFWQWG